MDEIESIKAEVMLLNWQETATQGAKLVLAVSSEDLEQFKLLTTKEGKRPGQRMIAVFVPIDDHEQPKKTPVGPLALLAYQWCRDTDFQSWIIEAFTVTAEEIANKANDTTSDVFDYPELAAAIIKTICGVSSRKNLDDDGAASKAFHLRIRAPYMQHKEESERAARTE